MVGVLIHLVPRTTYDLSNMTADVSCEVPVVRAIPLYSWASAVMLVPLYDNSLQGDAEVSISLLRSAPTEEDTYDDFIGSRIAFESLTSASADKQLYLSALGGTWPPYGDLVLAFGNVTAPNPGTITLAVDLLLRGRHFDRIHWAEDLALLPEHRVE